MLSILPVPYDLCVGVSILCPITVGAFSVIFKTDGSFAALLPGVPGGAGAGAGGRGVLLQQQGPGLQHPGHWGQGVQLSVRTQAAQHQ